MTHTTILTAGSAPGRIQPFHNPPMRRYDAGGAWAVVGSRSQAGHRCCSSAWNGKACWFDPPKAGWKLADSTKNSSLGAVTQAATALVHASLQEAAHEHTAQATTLARMALMQLFRIHQPP